MAEFGFDPADYPPREYLLRAPAERARLLSTVADMRVARRWLLYRLVPSKKPGKKDDKVPYYADGTPREGTLDTPEDTARLVTFEVARRRLAESAGEFAGLGFALGYDADKGGHWQGRDVDGSLEGMDLWAARGGYVELSPSGTGYHVIGFGRDFKKPKQEEWYSHGRFFTVTMNVVSDGPPIDLMTVNPALQLAEPMPAGLPAGHPVETPTGHQYAHLLSAFAAMRDDESYDHWANVGLALKSLSCGEELFDIWSRLSGKYDIQEVKEKWATGLGEGKAHWKSIFVWAANDYGWINPAREGPAPAEGTVQGLQYLLQNRVALNEQERAPEFALQDMILNGITTVVGYMGVGKTGTLLDMMLNVAGLKQTPGLPFSIRRKVVYLCEDDDQIKRLVSHWRKAGLMAQSQEEIDQWFIPVRVNRRKPDEWRNTIQEFVAAEAAAHAGEAWWATPVVVFDTGSASFNIENISDNTEVADLISHLKVAEKVPGWPDLMLSMLIVLHVPKHLRGSEAEAISAIGAQAWSADTRGTVIFSEDADTGRRLLTLAKRRFETFEDVSQWSISSYLLEPAEIPTAWAAQYPQLAVYRSTSRVIEAFEPFSKEALREEKQQKRDDNKYKEAKKKFAELIAQARRAGQRGLALYAPGEKGGKRPDEYLFCSWTDVYPTRSKSDPGNDILRDDLIRQYSGKRGGEEQRFVLFDVADLYGTGTRPNDPSE